MRKPKELKPVKAPRSKAPGEVSESRTGEVVAPVEQADDLRAARETRSEAFKALGDPIRMAICEFLAECAPREQTAGAVCRAVTGDKKITAKVSHHLKELRRAGLVAMHKDGKNVLCALDVSGTTALAAYLSAWSTDRENGAAAKNVWITSDENELREGENNDDSTDTMDTDTARKKPRRANAA